MSWPALTTPAAAVHLDVVLDQRRSLRIAHPPRPIASIISLEIDVMSRMDADLE
jgi:hypothetical protein